MRFLFLMGAVALAVGAQTGDSGTVYFDFQYTSRFFESPRDYRIFLPPAYGADSTRRFPVIYFCHGCRGRFNGPPVNGEGAKYYDDARDSLKRGISPEDNLSDYVKTHDLIVVKADGYIQNGGCNVWNYSPVTDTVNFTDYIAELVGVIDSSYRTVPDREHRAISGLSMGGYMSLFFAARYPQLVCAVGAFAPGTDYINGPLDQQNILDLNWLYPSLYATGVRVHSSASDFILRSHRTLAGNYRASGLTFEFRDDYPGSHGVNDIDTMFNFIRKIFRNPLTPRRWNYIDMFKRSHPYGYEVTVRRAGRGFISLGDVSASGFNFNTLESLPFGRSVPGCSTQVVTAPLYAPLANYEVRKYFPARDSVGSEQVPADGAGRLSFTLGPEAVQVAVGRATDSADVFVSKFILPVGGLAPDTALPLRALLFNRGGRPAQNITLQLSSPDTGVVILGGPLTLSSLAGFARDTALGTLTLTVSDRPAGPIRIRAGITFDGKSAVSWLPLEYTQAEQSVASDSLTIEDGRDAYVLLTNVTQFIPVPELHGRGNGDGKVEPGEKIQAFVTGTGGSFFPAQLLTDDPYIDSLVNIPVERNIASGGYVLLSQALVSENAPPGHVIDFTAKWDDYFEVEAVLAGEFRFRPGRISLAVAPKISVEGAVPPGKGFSLEVYPNPVTGRAVIYAPPVRATRGSPLQGGVQIFDLRGRLVCRFPAAGRRFEIPVLASGVYIARLRFNDAILERKFAVIR